jgi:hypothetical protein
LSIWNWVFEVIKGIIMARKNILFMLWICNCFYWMAPIQSPRVFHYIYFSLSAIGKYHHHYLGSENCGELSLPKEILWLNSFTIFFISYGENTGESFGEMLHLKDQYWPMVVEVASRLSKWLMPWLTGNVY